MTEKLLEWINDASAYELLNTYKIEQQVLYPFVNKGEDFYISLLNKLFFTLHEKAIDSEETKETLLQIVKGLIVYSDDTTAKNFTGVNRNNNLLYIAAIYYLCDLNALSILFIGKVVENVYKNESAQLLYCIMSGSINVKKDNGLCCLLDNFMCYGNEHALDDIEKSLENKISQNNYESLDDFFDTHIAKAVVGRFRVNNMWQVLSSHGEMSFWKDYIAYSIKRHKFTFLPSQEDAIRKGLLDYSRSFSLKMPTSAGKTYLTELLVYQEIKRNPNAKILYLAPLRSLSRELKEQYGRLSREFKFDFRAAYGGCTTSAEEETIEKAKVLIATPETFTTIEGSIENLISGYTLVICDEGQLLEDKNRGVDYELLLTRLKRNPSVRFLFISAIIPNISDINQWLGGEKNEIGDSKYRPCEIRLAQASETGVVRYADEALQKWYVKVDFFNDVQFHAIVGKTKKKLSCALALKAIAAGPVMLYCSMKDGHRGCIAHAEEIMSLLGKHIFKKPICYIHDIEWIGKVVEYCTYQLGEDYRLTKCVKEGIAYHHGQMPQDIRELIETAISKKTIQLVICTKTLSEGINMPIKTAILANITNPTDGNYRESLELRDLKNIVGRVGRAGKESYGLVLLPSDKENDVDKVLKVLGNNDVERANGALFYVVKKLIEKNLKTDAEINEFLESEGVAEAIDMLINLHNDYAAMIETNIDDVIQDSLAHYLGDTSTKQMVKNIFKVRYTYIKNTLPQDEYDKYLNVGLSLADYRDLKSMIADKTANDFIIKTPIDREWINMIVGMIYNLDSVKRDLSYISKKKPLYHVHRNFELVESILVEWISGRQYVEIAAITGCTTEQAALYVDFIQKTMSIKTQAIVIFVRETYDIDLPLMNIWPKMIKLGVSNEIAINLIDSGLSDRILVNLVADYVLKNYTFEEDDKNLIDKIVHDKAIDKYLVSHPIPELIKERWKQYLGSKGII